MCSESQRSPSRLRRTAEWHNAALSATLHLSSFVKIAGVSHLCRYGKVPSDISPRYLSMFQASRRTITPWSTSVYGMLSLLPPRTPKYLYGAGILTVSYRLPARFSVLMSNWKRCPHACISGSHPLRQTRIANLRRALRQTSATRTRANSERRCLRSWLQVSFGRRPSLS